MNEICALLELIDESRLRHDLFYLAQDPLPYRTLNFTLPGHPQSTLEEADAWLEAELQRAGYAVEREPAQVRAFGYDESKPPHRRYAPPPPDAPVYTAHNLYARKRGRELPEEIVLLLAHKDSQSWIESPGAYDNAVGTIAVLELARALAGYDSRRSIWFLLCNEEHTPWTSITAANRMRERGDNLIAIFNVDAVGGKSDVAIAAAKPTNVTLYTTPEGKALADLMAEVNERYNLGLLQSSQQRARPGDDDGSFVKAGYLRAVMNIGSYPYADAEYHLPGDRPERVDLANVALAAKATLAAVLELDAAP